MAEVDGIRITQHLWAWAVGGLFMALAMIIGLYSIWQHVKWNNSPMYKYEVRVLLMVPIYAIEAFMGLYKTEQAVYWDVLREAYESFVIYSFYQFLMTFLGGEEKLSEILYAKHKLRQKALENPKVNKRYRGGDLAESHHDDDTTYQNEQSETAEELQKQKEALSLGDHLIPCAWCMRPYNLGNGEFQRRMRFGILQYVPIKLICTIVTFATQLTGTYTGQGHFAMTVAYPYVAVITNCSQIWAMYCLVLFYNVLHEDLKPIKPLAKFISVKAVVFFTFWQSVFISVCVDINLLHATDEFSLAEISAGLQDFIICFEMVLAAILHIYIFPAKEFHDPDAVHRYGVGGRIRSFLDPKDIVADMHKHILVQVGKDVKKTGAKVKTKVLHQKPKAKHAPGAGLSDPIELGIASDAFETEPNEKEKSEMDSDSELEPSSLVNGQKESPAVQASLGTEMVRIKTGELAPPDETISSALFITPTADPDDSQQDRPLIF